MLLDMNIIKSSRTLQAVGNSIRKQRKILNISQEELAELSGLDRTYISGIERSVRNLTFNSLACIIKALNISEEYFFGLVIEELKEIKNGNQV
jgi:transcriptional regulator with XRE-family HTH domain